MKYLTILLSLLIAQAGQCCINEYRVLLSGKVVFTDASNAIPTGRFNDNDTPYLQKKLHEADSIYKLTGRIEDYSDFGSMLVYNGQYLQAKKIFQDIESKSPGLYNTAANLGTTYELLGQNDSAYFWIKRAIQINPNSHSGSEWIHLKILEAKVEANGNEKYLWTTSILGLDFGSNEIPENKSNINLSELHEHLYDQLNERISFIKPQDPIVAQLLFDLGNASALIKDATSGFQIYQSAKKYGYSSDLFEKRYSYFKSLQAKADFKNNTDRWVKENPLVALIILAIVFIGFVTGVVFVYRKFIKKRLFKGHA